MATNSTNLAQFIADRWGDLTDPAETEYTQTPDGTLRVLLRGSIDPLDQHFRQYHMTQEQRNILTATRRTILIITAGEPLCIFFDLDHIAEGESQWQLINRT